MPYRQDLTGCFAEAVGAQGLARPLFEEMLAATRPALVELAEAHRAGGLPLLRLPERRDDLTALAALAERWRARFDDVLLIGIGGASLGAKALCALAERGFGPAPGAPRLRILDNIDPDTLAAALEALDPARSGILAVSKSGATAETLAQLLVCIAWLGESGCRAADHAIAVTQPGDSPLRRVAAAQGMTVLDHPPAVGGRYSALSLVGLLPAAVAGLDIAALRAGAAEALAPILARAVPEETAPARGAAVAVALARHRGTAVAVLMPYADRLAPFADWHRQLWAESLGKDGRGTTPAPALGVTDQHSQLQLYLDGPADKAYTILTLDRRDAGPEIPAGLAADPELAYLAGRRIGALMEAEQRATIETLVRRGRPVRVIALRRLDERTMGALMMHFMLETILAARLFGVDPFDQPAVEEGKRLARSHLAAAPAGR